MPDLTELQVLNMINDNLIALTDMIENSLRFIFLAITIFYFRWEFKGGTFRR